MELSKELSLTTKDGEVIDIKIKWLPDFVNVKEKKILDLKTSWSMSMILEELQFKWKPNYTAHYIRQLSMYNFLLGGGYSWALALITTKWVKWIDVPNWILEKAWEQIEIDLIDLHKFIQDPSSINESIFKEEDLEL
jgi:hypothetical protein